jgi:hypothetical protein
MDFADCFYLLIFRDFTEDRVDAIRDHHHASQDAEGKVKFRSRNDLGNPEEGKNNKKQVAGKNSESKEDPGFYSVFDAGLQQGNQSRSQGYGDRDAEEESLEERM